jgi:hypothetical protein
MTTIYAGSNYGVISVNNSGAGTITSGSTINFAYELTQNYTSMSIFINVSGTAIGEGVLNIYFSDTDIGTNSVVENYLLTDVFPFTNTLELYPSAKYVKLELVSKYNASINYVIQTRFNNMGPGNFPDGVLSALNSVNNINLGSLSTYTGTFENITNYSLITIDVIGEGSTGPAPGNIKAIFSNDGFNNDRIVNFPVQDVTANGNVSDITSLTFNPTHTLVPTARYIRVDYENDNVALDKIRLSTIYHKNKSKGLSTRNTLNITDFFDADLQRSITSAKTLGTLLPGGHYQNIGSLVSPAQGYGNLCVGIRDPISAFGEVLTANLSPSVQIEFSAGLPLNDITIYQNSTTNTDYSFTDSIATIQASGTGSYVELSSQDFTKYKPGQGIDSRFTTVFEECTGTNAFAGMFTSEDSITFGYYVDDDPVTSSLIQNKFAIRYQSHGLQQINELSLTGPATANGTISLTFDTTLINVAVLNGDTAAKVSFSIVSEIEKVLNLNTYGWRGIYFTTQTTATPTSYNINLIRRYSKTGNIPITINTGGTGITLTNAVLVNGRSPINKYFIKSGITGTNVELWNGDRCSDQGSLQQNYIHNPSGFRHNPQLGNVYRITYQYLGFGNITMFIEQPETSFFIPVHQIKYANTSTITNFGDPSFNVGIVIDKVNDTSLTTLKTPSLSIYVQGLAVPSPIYRSYGNTITINGSYTATNSFNNPRIIFGITDRNIFTSENSNASKNYRINRSNIIFTSITIALNAAPNDRCNAIFSLVKNPDLFYVGDGTGTQFYPDWRKENNSNIVYTFNGTPTTSTSTGITYTGGDTVVDLSLIENNTLIYNIQGFNITLSTDDTFIVSFNVITDKNSTRFDVTASLSWYINQ